MLFRFANNDMVRLEGDVQISTSSEIIKHYFSNLEKTKENTKHQVTFQLFIDLIIKLAYVAVNAGALFGSDNLLDGEFLFYFPKWVNWSKFNNSISYDYMGARDFPKPGNKHIHK